MGNEATPAWEAAYDGLVEHAASRGDAIRIAPQSLTVARAERPAFYAMVENVQKLLSRHVLGGEGVDGMVRLARVAARARGRIVEGTNLEAFNLPATLENFLSEPERTVAKPLFSLVLDALQNGRTAEELERSAQAALPPFVENLRRSAYEAWVYCTVVADLDPVRFYGVLSRDTVHVEVVDTGEVTVGSQITSPERRIPEAVFTTSDGRVFAMKTEAGHELDFYGSKITRRRDNSAGGNTVNLMGHRVLLLYRLGDVDEVGVVVDRDKLRATPVDLVCDVLEPADMATPAYVSLFVERIKSVRSRRPVQVVVRDGSGSFPDGMLDDPTVPRIEVRCVGDDASLLEPIARLLDDGPRTNHDTTPSPKEEAR